MFTPGAALTEGDPRGSARVSQGILVTGPPEVSRPLLLSIPPPPRPFITTDTPGGCSCVSCIVALGIKRNRLCTRLGEEQLCLQGTLVVRTGPCLGGAAGMLA